MFALGPIEIMMLLLVLLGGSAAVIAVVTSRRRAGSPPLGRGGQQRGVGDGFTEPTGYVTHQPTPPEEPVER